MNRYLSVLKPEVRLRLRAGGRLQVKAGGVGEWTWPTGHRAVAGALVQLRAGVDEEALADRVLDSAGVEALSRLYYFLDQLRRLNLLDYAVVVRGERLATLQPLDSSFRFLPARPPAQRLSRFAYLRREGGSTVIESPRVKARVILEGGAAGWPAGLGKRQSAAILNMMQQAGFLVDADRGASRAQRSWEFHDLLFHRVSRLTPGSGRVGGTYRFRGRMQSWPAIKPPMAGEKIPLARADLARLARNDRPLTEVLEARRSRRTPGRRPLTLGQVGEFLDRTARIREIHRDLQEETLRRVYPSGGAIHELEFYLCADRCRGLDRGLYHYHAGEHALYRLPGPAEQVERLLEGASDAWQGKFPRPQLLVILAARLPRVAWKYERMAYRLVLLNAGAALQTMYLVAEAMRLAPCAVGNGDPDVFAAATGLDPFEETSVAEFALSSRPAL